MSLPLMPKATAVWLIEKTALTFAQIAEFSGMHPLEVQAIADGEVASGINGYDPVANNQLTLAEIKRCEADPAARLKIVSAPNPVARRAKGARYTPVAKRNDRPDAIAFILRQFPQLSEAQIVRLLGTTKDTIVKIRNRQHWNSANIKPRDPVILGLCTQTDLNAALAEANAHMPPEHLEEQVFSSAPIGEQTANPDSRHDTEHDSGQEKLYYENEQNREDSPLSGHSFGTED